MKVEITIKATYDEATVRSLVELERQLYDNVTNAISRGLLTEPSHEPVVDTYSVGVRSK